MLVFVDYSDTEMFIAQQFKKQSINIIQFTFVLGRSFNPNPILIGICVSWESNP